MDAWVKYDYGWWCPVYTCLFPPYSFTGPEIDAFVGRLGDHELYNVQTQETFLKALLLYKECN